MENRIALDPLVHHGKPVIRGTRVPVDRLLGSLAGGMSFDEVASEYGVTQEDLQAALAYAADLVASEVVHPLAMIA